MEAGRQAITKAKVDRKGENQQLQEQLKETKQCQETWQRSDVQQSEDMLNLAADTNCKEEDDWLSGELTAQGSEADSELTLGTSKQTGCQNTRSETQRQGRVKGQRGHHRRR